jgi:hypothetical protein
MVKKGAREGGVLVANIGVGDVTLVAFADAGALTKETLPGCKRVPLQHHPLPLCETLDYFGVEAVPTARHASQMHVPLMYRR